MTEVLTPDLCIIGAGPGGLAAAAAARAVGATVVLIERDKTGGQSLNAGALPARALFAAGERAAALRGSGAFGITSDEVKVNFRKAHDHVQQVVSGAAPEDSAAKLEALGVELLRGEGKFTDPRTVTVGETQVRARRFIIATGARSFVPNVPGLLSVPYFTSETIFDNTRKLTHLVIIGAGPEGIELAQAYRRLGAEVTVIETGRALAGSDPELAEILLRRVRDEGVSLREDTEIVAVQARSMGIGVVVKHAEQTETLDVSHILVASGRVANLDVLDLDKARIRRNNADPRPLLLNSSLRTSNRRVYAIGDATGGPQLTHLAAHQGGLVVKAALLGLTASYDPLLVPRIIHADPEIAEIGLTEPMARARLKDNFRVLRTSYIENDRARATRNGVGIAKLIVSKSGKLLGAAVVGHDAGELIAFFAFAQANGLSTSHFAAFLAPYPSYAELAHKLGTEFQQSLPTSPWLRRLAALNRLLG